MIVNGKEYPLWSQFVERRKEWIGGLLTDRGDSTDRALFGVDPVMTEIVDITLDPNGEDSAFFWIIGKDFSCGFDVQHGGISPSNEFGEGWIPFYGFGGHSFGICQKPKEEG